MNRLDWWDDAACGPGHFNPDDTGTIIDEIRLAQMRLEVFFPVGDNITTSTAKKKQHPHSNNDPIYRRAQEICALCPVRRVCLIDALAIPIGIDTTGLRAGTTATDRRKMRDAIRYGMPYGKWHPVQSS
jgi:hypothetical protein